MEQEVILNSSQVVDTKLSHTHVASSDGGSDGDDSTYAIDPHYVLWIIGSSLGNLSQKCVLAADFLQHFNHEEVGLLFQYIESTMTFLIGLNSNEVDEDQMCDIMSTATSLNLLSDNYATTIPFHEFENESTKRIIVFENLDIGFDIIFTMMDQFNDIERRKIECECFVVKILDSINRVGNGGGDEENTHYSTTRSDLFSMVAACLMKRPNLQPFIEILSCAGNDDDNDVLPLFLRALLCVSTEEERTPSDCTVSESEQEDKKQDDIVTHTTVVKLCFC